MSLEDKLKAIKRVDAGETLKKVAKDLGVGEVTVGDWRRKRESIEQWCSQKTVSGQIDKLKNSRKTMKTCDFEKTSQALFMWFTELRSKGSPVNGPLLQEKALQFHKTFKDGDEVFTASNGWLHRWKTRYGIRQLNITGEKLSCDHEIVVSFKEDIKNLIEKENLSLEQLFNCDETGLNFRMLPNKTLAYREEVSAPGYKKNKDRVTLMACANATGNCKLDLVLIGKSAKPRAFKHIDIYNLPVIYRNQRSAWMDAKIFTEWFHMKFVPEVEIFLQENNLPRKAILLMDNCPAHPDVENMVSGEIKALFLPPNVTPLLQPMDQGVLENLKKNYKRKLLKNLITEIEDGKTVVECLKATTIKDVVYMTASAWEEVKPSTIEKSWKKLLSSEMPQDSNEENNDELLALAQQISAVEVNPNDIDEWMNADENLEVTDDMIVEAVNEVTNQLSEDEDDVMPEKISHSDGLQAIEKALSYIEQQPQVSPTDIMLLRRWREIAATNRRSVTKQKNLKDYFSSQS